MGVLHAHRSSLLKILKQFGVSVRDGEEVTAIHVGEPAFLRFCIESRLTDEEQPDGASGEQACSRDGMLQMFTKLTDPIDTRFVANLATSIVSPATTSRPSAVTTARTSITPRLSEGSSEIVCAIPFCDFETLLCHIAEAKMTTPFMTTAQKLDRLLEAAISAAAQAKQTKRKAQ